MERFAVDESVGSSWRTAGFRSVITGLAKAANWSRLVRVVRDSCRNVGSTVNSAFRSSLRSAVVENTACVLRIRPAS